MIFFILMCLPFVFFGIAWLFFYKLIFKQLSKDKNTYPKSLALLFSFALALLTASIVGYFVFSNLTLER